MSKKINIICFGNCDMLWNGGFVNGLKKYGANVTTFGFSNVSAGSHIYHLHRRKNIDIINNAELVILGVSEERDNEDIYKNNIRNYTWLYQELYRLQKKIVVIIWHYYEMYTKRYNNFHQSQCAYYGFNIIDIYKYCYKNNILNVFLEIPDKQHPLEIISQRLAIEICKNINNYKFPKYNIQLKKNINFTVCDELEQTNKLNLIHARNHIRKEFILKLEDKNYFIFPEQYYGKILIGIHTWNKACNFDHSWCVLENRDYCFGKMVLNWELFSEIYIEKFMIDSSSKIHMNYHNKIPKQNIIYPFQVKNDGIGLIGFLFCENTFYANYEIQNYDHDNTYDFSNILYFLKEYSTIIIQYNQKLILDRNIKQNENIKIINKLTLENTTLDNTLKSLPIQKQQLEIFNLEQDLINKKLQTKQLSKKLGITINDFMPKIVIFNPNSAKAHIYNHLSYKLGQALIENSKSILGYIRMPYVLSYIKDKHKFEQKAYEEKIKENPNLALPPLETYLDYNEALKEKECFTYKLGEAFIRASKNWYKGGYIKFILRDVPRLKREFGKR